MLKPMTVSEVERVLAEKHVPLARALEAADIDRSTWTRWRSGKTQPRLDRWLLIEHFVQKLLSDAVDISPDQAPSHAA